jgi:thioredoxin 1
LAGEFSGKLLNVKMNVDENPATPTKYGIRAIPTIIIFKNGEVLEQITGAVTKNTIKDMLTQKALA